MQRHGLFASVVVHVAVVLIALFGLPLPKLPDDFEPEAISLELISESDLQQLRQGQADGTPEEQKQPPPPPRQAQTPPPPPPPPAPAPQMTPPPEPPPPPRAPEPPKLAQLPPAARQPAPPQPTSQPTDEEDDREAVEWTPPKAPTRRPEPPKPQVAQAPPKPEPPKPEPPKPEPPKPQPPKPEPPKPEPPKPDPLKETLMRVQQMAQQPPKPAPQTPAPPQQTAQAQARPPSPPSPSTAPAQRGAPNSLAATGQLTAKEADALREHIRPCWNVDVGARDAQSLVVVIHAKIGPQGNVVSTEVTDRARYASDPAFRQAADRAMRALNNPRCNLLPLEPARAAQAMQEGFEFRFDPRDMF